MKNIQMYAGLSMRAMRVDAGAEPGSPVIVASGRYADEFARNDAGDWRIRSRRCEVENL